MLITVLTPLISKINTTLNIWVNCILHEDVNIWIKQFSTGASLVRHS